MIASLLTSDGVHLNVGCEQKSLDGLLAPPDPLVVGGALPLPVDLVLYTVLYCTVLYCTVPVDLVEHHERLLEVSGGVERGAQGLLGWH